MKYSIAFSYIPGTVLPRAQFDCATGMAFLDRIFYVNETLMLGEIRSVTGIDTSTLQNWVKRGWLANTVNRRYSKEHLARILIINMLRPAMQLEEIDRLLRYVNGRLDTTEDDIIPDSAFYDLICAALDGIDDRQAVTERRIREVARDCAVRYEHRSETIRIRLENALCVIVPACVAACVLRDVSAAYHGNILGKS